MTLVIVMELAATQMDHRSKSGVMPLQWLERQLFRIVPYKVLGLIFAVLLMVAVPVSILVVLVLQHPHHSLSVPKANFAQNVTQTQKFFLTIARGLRFWLLDQGRHILANGMQVLQEKDMSVSGTMVLKQVMPTTQ